LASSLAVRRSHVADITYIAIAVGFVYLAEQVATLIAFANQVGSAFDAEFLWRASPPGESPRSAFLPSRAISDHLYMP
jgi:hypothetical protein